MFIFHYSSAAPGLTVKIIITTITTATAAIVVARMRRLWQINGRQGSNAQTASPCYLTTEG